MKSLKELKDFLEDEQFDLNHEAAMVQSRILSPIISAIEDNKIRQEDLAEATGLTQPFISGLLNIRKNLSMEHIALFQKALGIVLQVPEVLTDEEHKSKFYSEEEYEIQPEHHSLLTMSCINIVSDSFTDYEEEVTVKKYKRATKKSLTRFVGKETSRGDKANPFSTKYIH